MRVLTVEDYGKLIAFDGDSLLGDGEGVESLLEHGLFLFLLVCHQVLFFLHIAVVISNLSPTPENPQKTHTFKH